MFIPVRVSFRKLVWPWATMALVAANVLMYLGQEFVLTPAEVSALVLQAGKLDPVTWLSSMFMHADLPHLLANMVFLWPFALHLEARIGWLRALALYVVSGLGAALMFQAVHWGEDTSMVGASGAVAGVLGLCAVTAPFAKLHVLPLHPVWMLASYAEDRSVLIKIPVLGWAFLWLFGQVMLTVAGIEGIAFAAHFGGLLAGVAVGLALRARAMNVGSDMFASDESLKAEKRERLLLQAAQAWAAKTADKPPVDYHSPRPPDFSDEPPRHNIPISPHHLDDDLQV